jgi:hypothetical protein
MLDNGLVILDVPQANMPFDNGVILLWLMDGVKSDDVTAAITVFRKEFALLCIAGSCDSSVCDCVSERP